MSLSAKDLYSFFQEKKMLTAKKMVKMLGLALAATVLFALVAQAADANQPEQPKPVIVRIQGTVGVVKDADGKVTSVTVTTKENEVYQVVLNEKGLELANKLDGKEAKVSGTVTKKDEQKWIDVHSFREVKKEPETPAETR